MQAERDRKIIFLVAKKAALTIGRKLGDMCAINIHIHLIL